MKKLFIPCCLFLSLLITFFSCKKIDSVNDGPMPLVDRFFTVPPGTSSEIKLVAKSLEKQNNQYHYLSSITKRAGYPRWDKAVIANFDKGTITARGSEEASGEIVYIPFVKDSDNYVNSLLTVKMDAADTIYRMLYAFNYRAFGYDTSDHTKWNARDVFNIFTSFDHSVFGHTKFWVRDTNLFKPKNDSSHVIVTRINDANSRSTARASVYTLQTCGTVTVCSNPGPAPEPAPSPKPALARLTDDCSTVEICTTFYYGGGSDGTGSTGGWTGTGDGTDGGGSGGTGWYGEPTSSVTCASAAVQRNSFIEPTGLCPSGWVPVSDNISMHLAIILNLNSTQTNWLLQNSAVAQEIEKALQESLSDENALTGLAYMDVYPDYAVAASRITIDAAMNSLINGPYDSWHFDLIKQNIPGWQNSSITDPVFWAMFNIQCTLIKIEHPEYNRWRVYWEAMGEVVHLGLDLAGLIPVIGEIADLTNGVIYTIEGNGVDAALSYASAIPVAGWFSASVKFAKKGIALADGTKTTFKWIKRTDNLINFGDRGQLRKVLGLAKGDLRIAHHIIPWGHGVDDVVQEAAKGNNAFHLNELLNGIPLTSIQHSGSHSLYSARVRAHLTSIKNNLVSSGNFNPTSAREAIQDLINNVIKPAIASQPNTPINQIVF